MNTDTKAIVCSSLLEIIGLFPVMLVLIAICAGIVALAVRRRMANVVIAHVLLAVACFGLGTTGWRMHAINSMLFPGGAVDPTGWLSGLGHAWVATGVVLPVVGIGFLMLAIAWMCTRSTGT